MAASGKGGLEMMMVVCVQCVRENHGIHVIGVLIQVSFTDLYQLNVGLYAKPTLASTVDRLAPHSA